MSWFRRLPRHLVTRLTQQFGLSQECIHALTKYPNVFSRNEHNALKVLSLLKRWDVSTERLGQHVGILWQSHESVDHQLHIIAECGVKLTLSTVEQCHIWQGCLVLSLKNSGLMQPSVDLVDTICARSFVDDSGGFKSSVLTCLGVSNTDSLPLKQVRTTLLVQLIKWRLQGSPLCNETADVTSSVYQNDWLFFLSLRLLDANIRLLLEAGLQRNQILNNLYLLRAHPHSLSQYLNAVQGRSKLMSNDSMDEKSSMQGRSKLLDCRPINGNCLSKKPTESENGLMSGEDSFPRIDSTYPGSSPDEGDICCDSPKYDNMTPSISLQTQLPGDESGFSAALVAQYIPRPDHIPSDHWWYAVAVLNCVFRQFHMDISFYPSKALLSLRFLEPSVLKHRLLILQKIRLVWSLRYEPLFLQILIEYEQTLARIAFMAAVNTAGDSPIVGYDDQFESVTSHDDVIASIEQNVREISDCISPSLKIKCRDLLAPLSSFDALLSRTRSCSNKHELIRLISCRLQLPSSCVDSQLLPHPLIDHISVQQVCSSLSWLLAENGDTCDAFGADGDDQWRTSSRVSFTSEQLVNALCACLYPPQVLARYSADKEYQEYTTALSSFPRHRRLQLLIYFIERDVYFNGTKVLYSE